MAAGTNSIHHGDGDGFTNARGSSRTSHNQSSTRQASAHSPRHARYADPYAPGLISFCELTDPPVSSSFPEDQGLTAGLQEGISGLYNRVKASVAGTRDLDLNSAAFTKQPDTRQTHKRTGPDKGLAATDLAASSQTGDDIVSEPLELPGKKLPASKLTPLSSAGMSIGRNIGQPVVPTITHVTIHAADREKTHTGQGSAHNLYPAEASGSRGVLSSVTQSRRTKPVGGEDRGPESHAGHHSSSFPPTLASQSSHLEHTHHSALGHEITAKPLMSIGLRTNADTDDDGPVQTDDDDEPNGHGRRGVFGKSSETRDESPKARSSVTSDLSNTHEWPVRSISQPQRLLDTTHTTARVSSQPLKPDSTETATSFVGPRFQVNHEPPRQPHPLRQQTKASSQLLDREYWMRDENARDCFRCGEPFTTFRRKHHCRACGQIFDSNCTALIAGSYFGATGSVRVCRSCETIVTTHDGDESSDISEDIYMRDVSDKPQTSDYSLARYDDDNVSIMSQNMDYAQHIPIMSLPLRRAVDKSNRNSAILEFDTTDRPLHRPSSSRSLRAAHSVGHHRRHHSKHMPTRNLKMYHDDHIPFQGRSLAESTDTSNPVFHRDSVIDPELAQYLSDEASEDDEPSIQEILAPSTSSDQLSKPAGDTDRSTISGLLAAIRRAKPRADNRSIADFVVQSRDHDDAASVISTRAMNGPRQARKRTLSIASSLQLRTAVKATRGTLQIMLPGEHNNEAHIPKISDHRSARMIRSSSMKGISAPAVELNRASLQHIHKLLRQLLKDACVGKASSWEDALVPILLKVADDVDPNVHEGDNIDIRSYVKIKKIPGGKPCDTSYTSGLVFTKNVALKNMQRTILSPRVLIIAFPLEYARSEMHFMSLDPVIRQEREYLQKIVSRIAALKPDILLARFNVSGLALELLDEQGIAVIFKVKQSVLEAVSRFTNASICTTMDKLNAAAQHLGYCDSFSVKTYIVGGRRKTYTYFSGCISSLGCTIALRGANTETLRKVKRITEFMVYVVYNLKLETCLMRDEWALLPSDEYVPPQKLHTKPQDSQLGRISHNNNDATAQYAENANPELSRREILELQPPLNTSVHPPPLVSTSSADLPGDVPAPTFYQDLADKHETRILSASPFVKFTQPYLLTRARELERRVAYLKALRDQDIVDTNPPDDKTKAPKFALLQPEMVHSVPRGASRRVREIIHSVHESEYDKALFFYEMQKNQWETHLSGNKNFFDPYAHQNITVLFSIVSTSTNVPCSGPDLVVFSFYNEHEGEPGFEADCTLGQYVEDLCFRANEQCQAESCGKRMHEHHRQYVHGDAQITVFTEHHPPKMRGLQDVVLMWSACRICGSETTVTPMSPNTWKYSFGKYLELSFGSADLHARAGGCHHDLHRDHLRFFGYRGFALRIHYDRIDLLEIVVPRQRITWKVDIDLKFRNDVFTKLEQRVTRFMSSVKLRLKGINIELVSAELLGSCQIEIESLTKRANEDHQSLIKHLQDRYISSKYYEIIPLNSTLRILQEKTVDWDVIFANFEKNFFPSENDISRLAQMQLRKIFLEKGSSGPAATADEAGITSPTNLPPLDEKQGLLAGSPEVSRQLSPERTQQVLESVVEGHTEEENVAGSTTSAFDAKPALFSERTSSNDCRRISEDLGHLDLAVSGRSDRKHSLPTLDEEHSVLTRTEDDDKFHDKSALISLTQSDPPSITATQVADPVDDRGTSVKSVEPVPLPQTRPRALSSGPASPVLLRAQSQPAGNLPTAGHFLTNKQKLSSPTNSSTANSVNISSQLASTTSMIEKLGFSSLKVPKLSKGQSLIPRAINAKTNTRVSRIAKHFEQLSREFEQERIRLRRQADRNRQSRLYPIAAPKPTVEVFDDVDDAVAELDDSEESLEESSDHIENTIATTVGLAATNPDDAPDKLYHNETTLESSHDEASGGVIEDTETQTSRRSSLTLSVEENSEDQIQLPDSPEDLLKLSQENADLKDLTKHERSSVMKLLSNFWTERSSMGWSALEYPILASDHIFTDCDVIVREDELSSIIAFALDSAEYKKRLHDVCRYEMAGNSTSESKQAPFIQGQQDKDMITQSLLCKAGTHLRYSFQHGSAKMHCKVFFSEQFDAMRRKCGVSSRFIESLSRCMKYENKGGKSKSLFLKTLDDRFVIKSLSAIETQSFLKFAPNYFQIMSEAFFQQLPSVIAKMLGFYQIIIRNPLTGVDHNYYLLVMENLFYDRVPTRIFDLKGSMRNRKINVTGEQNEVLLDENMVDFIYESPIFTREHSKRLLRTSVYNDTLFLARQNVMDYSLMVAIDESRKEIVVGIIDCIRTYTWDKKLESWIKDRGFVNALVTASGVGGPSGAKNRPTVTSPREYKRRFREAMGRYILEAPNCWHQFPVDRNTEGRSSSIRPISERAERVLKDDKDGEQVQTMT